MKQKIKHLQSSGETRKTSRTWHFLSNLNSLLLSKLLLLLIIPVMGTAGAWADSVDITQNSAGDKTWTSGNFTVDMTSGTGQDDGVVKLGNGGTCVISTSGSETITGATITYGKGGSDSYTARTADISTSAIVSDTGSRFSFGSFTSNVLTVSVDGNTYVKQVTVTYTSGGGGSGYTITYDVDGRASAISSEAGATALPASLPSVSPNAGYSFTGWFTDEERTVAAVAGADIAGNTTLYANYQIIGSISSSPIAGSTVKAGDPVYTTATTSASGVTQMRIAQGGGAYSAETLKTSGNLVGITDAGWGVSGGATLGTNSWVLSALLTDGKYYSDVLTNTFSVGVAAPSISCSSNTVTITSATTLASTNIYYTLDGTEPTSSSTLYSAPFAITATKTVKAIAINGGNSSAVSSQECVYADVATALPVTVNFNASPFSTSTDFSGASGSLMNITQDNHKVYFRGSNQTEFSIVNVDSKNYLQHTQNAATNHFIAIPISGINGRIDVQVWAPYELSSNFKVRAYLDTTHGTTVQTTASGKPAEMAMDKNTTDGSFDFRIKDITVTDAVLYIGVNSSSFQKIEKIKVTSPTHILEADPASVTMGDGETFTVSIKNHSAQYLPALGNVPAYVSASLNPSTGELVITPKAIGTGGEIELAIDTDGDGSATDVDLTIPVTVKGLTITSHPASAVYAYGASVTALSVSATQNDGGSLTYQWYKNNINSTVGGTAISGATSASYTPSTTLAAEDASFYYCVVSSSKSTSAPKTSNVAYVLTSSTQRYFQMSNVAGNRQTSEASEAITGEVIAGGSATAIHSSGESFYRYIQRPEGKPHMYVVGQDHDYITVTLGKNIAVGDRLSVRLMGYLDTEAGLVISDGTHSINIDQTDDTEKDYTNINIDDFAGKSTLYIKGKRTGMSNFFTNLIIYTPGAVKVSDPTPDNQTVGKGNTPSAISVTASDGTGNFSYKWQYSPNGTDTWNDVTTGTGYTTATFTPAASSPSEETTTYYRCIVTDEGTGEPKTTVTSGVASVTVESVTRDYYKISTGSSDDATFEDGVLELRNATLRSTYTVQNGESRSYWTLNNSTPGTNDGTYFEGEGDNSTLSVKSTRVTKSVFYVKGAASVKFVGHTTDANRKYNVTIDGESMGTQTLIGTATECPAFALNKGGSVFEIDYNSSTGGDVKFASFIFYENLPSTITIKKDNVVVTEAIQYPPFSADGAVDYTVESNSDGAIEVESDNTGVATVVYSGGVLTVTPVSAGVANIAIRQAASGEYSETLANLKVTVNKAEVTMSFNYDKVVLTASELDASAGVIPTVKMPTLTVTHADGTTNTATINWESDDANLISVVGSGSSATTYTVTYHKERGQGGARLYAYVNETEYYGAAAASFDVVIQNGTSNNLPEKEKIDVQEQFVLANDGGQEVIMLTYGGYKYNDNKYKYIDFKSLVKKDGTDSWTGAASFNKYYIDGYKYNSHNENDAYNEYGYQLLGMSDDYHSGNCPDGMWYKTTETKPQGGNYGNYERIRPFALACKGGYLKFEPKKSGVLTVYILQNGVIGRSGDSDLIGSKPRLGYWFDEDGWVQTDVTAVAKQPISNGNGLDKHVAKGGKDEVCEDKNLGEQMDAKWTGDDAVIIPMLKKPYCNLEKTVFSDTQEPGYIDNPYFWGVDAQVIENNKRIIPRRITPVPFHNGFMVPEQCYVKYTLPVIAGKSYYFYGMMTKIGYVGMNFVEDEDVLTENGNDIVHTDATLHLTSNDNMATYTFNGNVLAKSTLFDEVTLPSNYRPNQWNTICLPFALSETQVEAAFGKGTQVAIYNGLEHKSDEHLYYVKYLRHVDQNILPGQPYLIYPTGVGVDQNDGLIGTVIGTSEGAPDNNKRITFNDVLIEKDKLKQAYTSYGSNVDVDGSTESFIFTGTYQKIAMPQYSLFYSPTDGKLYRWTGTSSTPNFAAYHAYMHPNSSSVMQNGIEFSFSEDDITDLVDETGESGQETGIVIVEEIGGGSNAKTQLKNNTKSYNLMGQEIDPRSAKGLVIVNGEKVMY